ncbi:RDD family protein [Aureimonas sp. AU20]|uniref:RDD family protein n=1 Tax=Aureimonas sp. AU20 TaxID=1349819 RepID=UPI00071EC2A0|nr:RDD family protein [Aureimonas sp. AU20]ALN73096.1 hypothetical protein M673_10215 [Aureimonas sp. AU20]
MDDSAPAVPAGFWRRAIALVIDWAICSLILACVAVLLFAATGGRLQFIPNPVPAWCQDVDPIPSELRLPADFVPNVAKSCIYTLFGLPAAHVLTLTQRTVEGNFTTNVNMKLTVDADGMAWGGGVKKGPTEELLILFRLLFDTFGRSPGRRVCGIAIVERGSGRRAPFSSLWKRYLLFSIPIGLGYLYVMSGSQPVLFSNLSASFIGFGLVPLGIFVALSVWNVVWIVRRQPAYYDRPVGTSVERR